MSCQHSEYLFLYKNYAYNSNLGSLLNSFAERFLVYFLLFGSYFMVDRGKFILAKGRTL
jgi:hypothetical protein